MATDGALTIDQLRQQLRTLTVEIRTAEDTYKNALENSADAEAAYRAALAGAYKKYRLDGAGVSESETLARGDVVLASRERDSAAGKVKHAAEVLENRRDDRRQLWRLVDVLRPRTTATTEPGETWP